MSTFNRSDRLAIELPDLLTDIAAPNIPDYVDDVLAVTAVTRQRPRWTFPERWLPMSAISSERVGASNVPWRLLLTVALVIVLAALAVAFAGSQRRVPAPFGPARAGAIVFGNGGDIYVRDALDSQARILFAGPTDDLAANFTRDGSRLVWLRHVSGTPDTSTDRIAFVVANLDGSNAREVSGGLQGPDQWDISPDGRSVVVEAGDGEIGKSLSIVDLVGTAGAQTLDVGDPSMTMSWPSFMGPNGSEIVFRGRTSVAAGRRAGIFAFDPATKHLRPLTPTDGETDAFYQAPVTSDDGRYLTYTDWSPELQRNSIHLVDLRTGDDRVLDDGTTRDQGYAGFSPDGRYLAFTSYDGQLGSVWLEAVDGSSPARQVGPAYAPSDTGYLFSRFSPDARSILLVNEPTKETRLVDVEKGGQGRVIDWTPGDTRAWQRLAP